MKISFDDHDGVHYQLTENSTMINALSSSPYFGSGPSRRKEEVEKKVERWLHDQPWISEMKRPGNQNTQPPAPPPSIAEPKTRSSGRSKEVTYPSHIVVPTKLRRDPDKGFAVWQAEQARLKREKEAQKAPNEGGQTQEPSSPVDRHAVLEEILREPSPTPDQTKKKKGKNPFLPFTNN